MFEKDIYQLIRGMRAHKGDEREYIQACLRECRKEVRSQDMDQKATALLKLIYLEMFGHDMSWASFNVLEVMSSTKYLQKRVGYLAAMQTFRPDTEVLMLAENLLKKDLGSPDKIVMALPLIAIPHVVSSSMANSLLTDLIPRLSHSSAAVRKKAIVTSYRLALVYPESLRPTWPKLKDRLLDEDEDPSVTAAVVNVVCELGWRRPQDFLPLAPRLFELLTAGGNNWMAIKIIKLFSILTPLEPRLVKKLLPPLTTIIKTTPAMSLLYECINGIIQGGIMEAAEGMIDGDEIARLCVTKLRAMLVVEGDPNLRYVALLALVKITSSHAELVSLHQDVILGCVDDGDISIRSRALDLIAGMISANNLQMVVERLVNQLRNAGSSVSYNMANDDRVHSEGVIPMADDDDEDAGETIRQTMARAAKAPPLPDEYRTALIQRILEMCSKDTYANITDFEWYIGVLVELVEYCPTSGSSDSFGTHGRPDKAQLHIADSIGAELLNVAVRVKAVRAEAAAAAQSLLLVDRRDQIFSSATNSRQGVLSAAAFIAGEYAQLLPDADAVLTSLAHSCNLHLNATVLRSMLQAIPKVFSQLTSNEGLRWTASRQSNVVLMAARVTYFLEKLTLHPSLEVQERAVEYLDLFRLASEAASAHNTSSEENSYTEAPLLLTQAIPALFMGMELNPVAPAALKRVPLPEHFDLNEPINGNLNFILQQAEYDADQAALDSEVTRFYHEKPSAVSVARPKIALDVLENQAASQPGSYQDSGVNEMHADAIERRKAGRRERYKEDPYYIDSERNSDSSNQVHSILKSSNGDSLDVDAIPVMELKLDRRDIASDPEPAVRSKPVHKPKRRVEITGDETLGGEDTPASYSSSPSKPWIARTKKSLLEVDSSALSSLSLNEDGSGRAATQLDYERRQAEEEEMARALKEVERLRLEMQRAQERVELRGVNEEGTIVKRKKKKRITPASTDRAEGLEEDVNVTGEVKKKRKKKKPRNEEGSNVGVLQQPNDETAVSSAPSKVKKKKKRVVAFDDDENA